MRIFGTRKVMILLVVGIALAGCESASDDALSTPFVEPTESAPVEIPPPLTLPPAWTAVPGLPGSGPPCSCEANLYNCADFQTAQEAQTCYNSCGGANNDVHLLDEDLDGISCETYIF